MSRKPPLLFLSHRIPFPPNKGDKIRSYHILRILAAHYNVYLATFVDDREDWVHCARVRSLCADTLFLPLRPELSKLFSLLALPQGVSQSLIYFRNRRLREWVRKTVDRQEISKAFVVSSPMAQYLTGVSELTETFVDFVDLDSEKWSAYAPESRWPLSMVYVREARTLLQWETAVARRSTGTFFVSDAELALFRQRAGMDSPTVQAFKNGVDGRYFSPDANLSPPFTEPGPNLVFTGAMDYLPNGDAMNWFVTQVLPLIRVSHPGVRLWIVGGNPSAAVQQLATVDGVTVTGRVEDVRPYLRFADAVIAPMRIARGIQNKVLEGMAMARPVVVSPEGLEGIPAVHGKEVLIARDPDEYANAITDLTDGQFEDLGSNARRFVNAQFTWDANIQPLLEALGS